MSRRYWLTYDVRAKANVTKEELAQRYAAGEAVGAADCLVVVSILGRPLGDGPLNVQAFSVDGETGEALSPAQIFEVWAMLGHSLGQAIDDPRRAAICDAVVREVRELKGLPRDPKPRGPS